MGQLPRNFVGSISEATMRTQDLVPTFIRTLSYAEPEHTLVKEYAEIGCALQTIADVLGQTAEDVAETVGLWDSEHMSYFLNEEVFMALNDVAPEGTYFGSSEGDGASYGFWYMDCDVCGLSLYEHSPEGQPCGEDEDEAQSDGAYDTTLTYEEAQS